MSTKVEALLKGIFGKDAEGNVYIRTVVAKPSDLKNAVSTQSHSTLESLLSSAIVLDENGNPAIRLAGVKFSKTREQADRERRTAMAAQRKKEIAEQAALHGEQE